MNGKSKDEVSAFEGVDRDLGGRGPSRGGGVGPARRAGSELGEVACQPCERLSWWAAGVGESGRAARRAGLRAYVADYNTRCRRVAGVLKRGTG